MALPLDDGAPADFDFIIGDWVVSHLRLNERLAGCTEWTEFSGMSSTRNPTQLDTPVAGRFSGTTGPFYADDVLHGKPIKVRFTWFAVPNEDPRWEQAFSGDAGATWETNWTMRFMPAKNASSIS